MQLTQVGNANFINQNAPVVSAQNANNQARFDLQAGMTTQIAADKNEQVTELRPTEESYKIDPENEHEKKKNDQNGKEEQNLSQDEEDENAQVNTSEYDEFSSDDEESGHINIIV
ncbi:MAG: hypothetical protein K5978_03585 [Campylobacter sp.]|nr:hypothetical protein [Campylobacter sp.]